ncbi:hypothetical protein ABFS82_01G100300 [Erythranthe guttata]
MGDQSQKFILLVLILQALCWQTSFSAQLPFILLHGVNSQCTNDRPTSYMKRLTQWSGAKGSCLEIGNGTWSSWFIPLDKQVEEACNKVKGMKELANGYNIVGISQGNLVGRGIVEFCEGSPPVNNLISIGAPQAGIASVPRAGGVPVITLANNILKAGIYSDYAQKRFAPSGYTKLPKNIKGYLKNCKFLPKLNNERPNDRNPNYKKRLTSLNNLVLIMHENETVVKPKESSWFGYYEDGNDKKVLQPRETKLYKEDWIGLKTLDKAGRVKFIKVGGPHVQMLDEDIKKYVIPYLQDKKR